MVFLLRWMRSTYHWGHDSRRDTYAIAVLVLIRITQRIALAFDGWQTTRTARKNEWEICFFLPLTLTTTIKEAWSVFTLFFVSLTSRQKVHSPSHQFLLCNTREKFTDPVFPIHLNSSKSGHMNFYLNKIYLVQSPLIPRFGLNESLSINLERVFVL